MTAADGCAPDPIPRWLSIVAEAQHVGPDSAELGNLVNVIALQKCQDQGTLSVAEPRPSIELGPVIGTRLAMDIAKCQGRSVVSHVGIDRSASHALGQAAKDAVQFGAVAPNGPLKDAA